MNVLAVDILCKIEYDLDFYPFLFAEEGLIWADRSHCMDSEPKNCTEVLDIVQRKKGPNFEVFSWDDHFRRCQDQATLRLA